jgi:hypothetical protein
LPTMLSMSLSQDKLLLIFAGFRIVQSMSM